MKLDQKTIAKLPLPEDKGKPDIVYFDKTLSGFGLRYRDGRRSWIIQYRVDHRQRRISLGPVEKLGPSAAREAAEKLFARITLGDDPQGDKRKDRADGKLKFAAVVEDYLADKRPAVRDATFRQTQMYLRQHWRPLHAMPIAKVARPDVAAVLATIKRTHGPVSALRARVALSGFFTWAMGEGIAESNAVVGTNRPAEPPPRDRVLSNGELAAIWAACRDDDHGRIVKLLALTGARRTEVGRMTWSELDLDRGLWCLPGIRTKNGRPHTLPLPALTLAVIAEAPRRDGNDHLFGRGEGFDGYTRAKRGLDARIASRRGEPLPAWTLHDLRRTCATRMADLGVQPHVIESCLNHVSGFRRGVAGTYNRSPYEREVAAAFGIWADHIQALVEGTERKVVPFRANI